MSDSPWSAYMALDGPHLDGLIGSAGVLRFDWPERTALEGIGRTKSFFRDIGIEPAPFARIDRMERDSFDIYWMRHTGQWWRLYTGKTLTEALRIIETDNVLHPV